MKSISPQVKALLDGCQELNGSDLAQFQWHLSVISTSTEAEEAALNLKEDCKKLLVIPKQGRVKAEHYARMRIATATLELKRATEELECIYREWESLDKDQPIYWERGKLIGDQK
jgi:hypothetical protein